MALHAVRNTTAARSPERAALAKAIAGKLAADAKLEAQRRAVERAERLVSDAEHRLASAAAAVGAAREQQGRAVAEAVSAGSRPPASALRAARAAELEATDELDAANGALKHLREQTDEAEAETARASMEVERAINGVLANAAAGCEARIALARNNLHEQLSVAAYVRARGRERQGQTSSFREIPTLAAALAAVAGEIDSALLVGTGAWDSSAALANPILGRWEKAVAELRVDADALLPD